jgi:3-phenylpropionate/trans-cinnamate dioxygenase ferredoxin reductase subunit
MANDPGSKPSGPDLKAGIRLQDLHENKVTGHVDGDAVLLARVGGNLFAVGANCTHYGGPLGEGIITGDEVHCPWHHACFSLRTGEVRSAPALSPIKCYSVQQDGDLIRVLDGTEKKSEVVPSVRPSSVVVVGAGAAGAACVDMLRSCNYAGPVTFIGNEEPGPVDRPNLSKDYLAGNAPEEWIPLRTREYYESNQVEFILGDPAQSVDPPAHKIILESGKSIAYGALLLATGAEPKTLPIPGADLPHVHYLRTLADSRSIIAASEKARHCVVIGCSFIGLEVAASLRQRGKEVTIVAPESVPLGQVLGPDLGRFVRDLHEEHGVKFQLTEKPAAIREDRVELSRGKSLDADLVVIGVGVSPRVRMAEAAGIPTDNGITVDETLRTNARDIYAAGDVANYPDWISGQRVRIEHWVLAERQGQAVARAMLGFAEPYRGVPFFWSQHYDVQISYVGSAPSWDSIETDGDLKKRDFAAFYRRGGKILAVATIGRDQLSLIAEERFKSGPIGSTAELLKASS